MREFQPGHEKETEEQCAKAFHRFPRKYKDDPPFYPWLPCSPKVNFHLRFNC